MYCLKEKLEEYSLLCEEFFRPVRFAPAGAHSQAELMGSNYLLRVVPPTRIVGTISIDYARMPQAWQDWRKTLEIKPPGIVGVQKAGLRSCGHDTGAAIVAKSAANRRLILIRFFLVPGGSDRAISASRFNLTKSRGAWGDPLFVHVQQPAHSFTPSRR